MKAKAIGLNRKLLLSFLSISVLAISAPTIAEARDYDRQEERRKQQRIAEHRENMRKYPYNEHTQGIAMLRGDPGVQKCLRWVSWAPVYHKQRSPYIEHALYDIGLMGDELRKYENLRDSDMMDIGFYNNVQGLITRGERAMDYCNQLPRVPEHLNPNYTGGR